MSEFAMPWPAVRLYCPLPECSWACDEPPPDPGAAPVPGSGAPDGVAAAIGAHVTGMLIRQATAAEALVKSHLETHSLLEWVTEINRMTGLMGLVALELGGRIGQLTALVAAPGSPAAEGRTECLEWLRQGIGSKTHPDLASFITGMEAGRD